MARLKVLIAGGGIGGITALLALRQRGIDVELFEQTAAFGQVGAGVSRARVAGLAPDISPLLKIHGCWSDPPGTV